MTTNQIVLLIVSQVSVLLLIAGGIWYLKEWKKIPDRPTIYRVRATVGNVRHTLTLNEEQYARFKDWVNGADGYFDIGDDNEWLVLERKAMTCVEVRKK